MAYVFRSDGAVACVAVSDGREAFPSFRAAPEAELDRRLRAHAGLAGRLAATTAVGRVAGAPPEASWMRTQHGPGWALVGDAAVHQDPWSGEGTDNAGADAVCAADAIAEWLAGHASEEEAMARRRAKRHPDALSSFDECTSRARDLAQLAGG